MVEGNFQQLEHFRMVALAVLTFALLFLLKNFVFSHFFYFCLAVGTLNRPLALSVLACLLGKVVLPRDLAFKACKLLCWLICNFLIFFDDISSSMQW